MTSLVRTALILGLIDSVLSGLRQPLLVGGLGDALRSAGFAALAWLAVRGVASLLATLTNRVTAGRIKDGIAVHALATALVCTPLFALSAQALDSVDALPVRTMPWGLAMSVGLGLAAGLLSFVIELHIACSWGRTGLVSAPLLALLVPWSTGPANTHGRPNVVLISIDTLRADHLGAYGYPRATSPRIDLLARESVVFEQAMSASHWTLPSHAALLTGVDPVALDILDTDDALGLEVETLAESLDSAGWHTAAFVGNRPASFIGARRGLAQGFDLYEHLPIPRQGMESSLLVGISKLWFMQVDHQIGAATHQVDAALRWLDRRPDAPFFLFLHLFDVHSDTHKLPYEAPGTFRDLFVSDPSHSFAGCHPTGLCASELLLAYASGQVPARPSAADIQRMIDLYDGGIAYTDEQVGRLLDALHSRGVMHDTLIALTSDHGESFWEHGVPLHGNLHQENLHVPLLISGPGISPGRRTEVVQNLDIAPTILSYLGLAENPRSLLGENRPGGAFSASAEEIAWTGDRAKILSSWVGDRETSPEMGRRFDRPDDLEEKAGTDVALNEDELGARMLEWLRRSTLFRATTLESGGSHKVELSAQDRDDLRAIGYGE